MRSAYKFLAYAIDALILSRLPPSPGRSSVSATCIEDGNTLTKAKHGERHASASPRSAGS